MEAVVVRDETVELTEFLDGLSEINEYRLAYLGGVTVALADQLRDTMRDESGTVDELALLLRTMENALCGLRHVLTHQGVEMRPPAMMDGPISICEYRIITGQAFQ